MYLFLISIWFLSFLLNRMECFILTKSCWCFVLNIDNIVLELFLSTIFLKNYFILKSKIRVFHLEHFLRIFSPGRQRNGFLQCTKVLQLKLLNRRSLNSWTLIWIYLFKRPDVFFIPQIWELLIVFCYLF
jgi:hypothetical protein